ncbi:hypothetical protein RB195_001829 [Necator americanus]|uniref:Peptidase A2 domain-containing protein n=1 Tax=Necator americanus TaxID=51031 RepID=A0ABR1DGP2_NECAM
MRCPLNDTLAAQKELLGHNTSVFARRYAYLKKQRNEENLRNYTGLVNQRHAMAEFDDVTPEQMKCLVWICGLVAPQDADVRVRALRKIEVNSQTMLKELAAKVQHFLRIRQDAALLDRPSLPHFNVVKSRNQEMPRLQTLWTQARILKNFLEKKKRKSANTIAIASTHGNVAVNRIYSRIQIGGKKVRMLLDTAADVKLLSTPDWTAMGRAKL